MEIFEEIMSKFLKLLSIIMLAKILKFKRPTGIYKKKKVDEFTPPQVEYLPPKNQKLYMLVRVRKKCPSALLVQTLWKSLASPQTFLYPMAQSSHSWKFILFNTISRQESYQYSWVCSSLSHRAKIRRYPSVRTG